MNKDITCVDVVLHRGNPSQHTDTTGQAMACDVSLVFRLALAKASEPQAYRSTARAVSQSSTRSTMYRGSRGSSSALLFTCKMMLPTPAQWPARAAARIDSAAG